MEAFLAVGGYREDRLYAEDVRFLLDLKTYAKSTGRRLSSGSEAPTVRSARKFDLRGDWHYFTLPIPMMLGSLRGKPGLAMRYWYKD